VAWAEGAWAGRSLKRRWRSGHHRLAFPNPPRNAVGQVVHFPVPGLMQFLGSQAASPTSCAIHQDRSVSRDGIHGVVKVGIPPIVFVCGAFKVAFGPFLGRPNIQEKRPVEFCQEAIEFGQADVLDKGLCRLGCRFGVRDVGRCIAGRLGLGTSRGEQPGHSENEHETEGNHEATRLWRLWRRFFEQMQGAWTLRRVRAVRRAGLARTMR